MVEKLQKRISDSATARWIVLIAVSLTMFAGYYICDVMSPLKSLLEHQMGWSSSEYGLFMSSYGWLNVLLVMLIVGGIILDKKGPRFTGIFGTAVMVVGTIIKYYAVQYIDPTLTTSLPIFGTIKTQLFTASVGYAIFAFGYETFGITATKIIVRWFKGKEMALALGINVSVARLGTALALAAPIPIIETFQTSLGFPILLGMVLLLIGFLGFMVFYVMDRKLDGERAQETLADDEKFRLKDILLIINNRGFWYIATLCLLFYSCIFPFLKYTVEFLTINYGVDPKMAGLIPTILPFGAIFITPLFGGIYDRKGKGTTIMLIGSLLLVFVYAMFSISSLNNWLVAVGLMVVLGFAFGIVPSAMWPSVAKIIPEKRLGTAYSLIFWVQNIGLAGVPGLIGWTLDKYGKTVTPTGESSYDYSIPIYMFLGLAVLAVMFALLLKREDRIKGYGLEKPNIVSEN